MSPASVHVCLSILSTYVDICDSVDVDSTLKSTCESGGFAPKRVCVRHKLLDGVDLLDKARVLFVIGRYL
jgi:hypothetical protein